MGTERSITLFPGYWSSYFSALIVYNFYLFQYLFPADDQYSLTQPQKWHPKTSLSWQSHLLKPKWVGNSWASKARVWSSILQKMVRGAALLLEVGNFFEGHRAGRTPAQSKAWITFITCLSSLELKAVSTGLTEQMKPGGCFSMVVVSCVFIPGLGIVCG